jgi:hypothetical protein
MSKQIMLFRSKRGISQLHATLITITIVIIGGSLVASIFVNNTQVISARTQLNIQSANLVKDTGGNVAFTTTIKNTGTTPITSLTAQLSNQQPLTVTIPAGGLQPGRTVSASSLPTGGFISGETYIVVVEAISSGGSSVAQSTSIMCQGSGPTSPNPAPQRWLAGWQYQKSHTVNPATDAGTSYQIRVTAYFGSGTDNAGNVYLNSHSRTDFGDVRFTASDGVTPLNYWMQSQTASNSATIWVQIPDDLSTNAATIYIYYGNPTATTTSNGYNTFQFFDDFSTTPNGWTFSGSNAYISNGLLTINSISSAQSFAYKTAPTALTNYRFSFSESFTGNNAGFRAWPKATATSNINLPGVFVGRDVYYNPVNQVSYITQGGVSLPRLNPARNANWHTITVTKYGSTYTDYWDALTSTATDSTAETGNYVQFACEWNAGGGLNVDWIFLSKYVNPEPAHGEWEPEQAIQ